MNILQNIKFRIFPQFQHFTPISSYKNPLKLKYNFSTTPNNTQEEFNINIENNEQDVGIEELRYDQSIIKPIIKGKNKEKLIEIMKEWYKNNKDEANADKFHWWTNILNMDPKEIQKIPERELLKYSRYLLEKRQYDLKAKVKAKNEDPRYTAHRTLYRMQTDSEVAKVNEKKLRNVTEVFPNSLHIDFLKTENRVEHKVNYNFEQYAQYTRFFNSMKAKDREEQVKKQILLKYLKTTEGKTEDALLNRMEMSRDMIPEYDVEVGDFKAVRGRRNKHRRKYVLKKHNTDIRNYTAWRCFDRDIDMTDGRKADLKIKLSPYFLRKVYIYIYNILF